MNTLYSQDQECLLVLGGFFEVIVIPIMTTIRCQYTIIRKPLKTWIWHCFLKEGGTHWLLFYVRMKSDKLWPQKLLTQKLATKCWLHFFPRKNLFSQIFFYKHLLSEKKLPVKIVYEYCFHYCYACKNKMVQNVIDIGAFVGEIFNFLWSRIIWSLTLLFFWLCIIYTFSLINSYFSNGLLCHGSYSWAPQSFCKIEIK